MREPQPARDALYAEAAQVVRTTGRPSISTVQRHLRIGYNRAALLMEQLEAGGVVTVMDRWGSRKVVR